MSRLTSPIRHDCAILRGYALCELERNRHSRVMTGLFRKSHHSVRRRPFATAAVVCVAAALSACAGNDATSEPPKLAGLSCVDDSHHCIAQRGRALDGYMADKSRSWVKHSATPEAYASGVRLFALSRKKKELSCDELLLGKREADGAPASLRGPGGKNLTPAQVSRGVMLAGDVSRELSREYKRRCSRA